VCVCAALPAHRRMRWLWRNAHGSKAWCVVGYWFQVHQGMKDFDSQRVNAELKNMGHGVGNITDAFTTLIDGKPQYVIQTRKSGTSRQARKLYRVTNEGSNRVRDLLGGSRDDLQ
jgi:hypothetical protein